MNGHFVTKGSLRKIAFNKSAKAIKKAHNRGQILIFLLQIRFNKTREAVERVPDGQILFFC